MIVNFTNEEKGLILNLLDRYNKINTEWSECKKEADDIQERLSNIEIRLKAAKQEEDDLMNSLKNKYGDFGLMDIHETLLKNE